MFEAMRQGISFIAGHDVLRWIVLAFFISAIFARPYAQLIPALTVNVLHAGARGLGWAVSAAGIGGFGGAMATAYFAQRDRRSRLWLIAGLTMSTGVLFLGIVTKLIPALPVIFIIGIGTMALLGATNTLIQILSPDEVRGRAIAVYTMIAIGIVPLGSFIDGTIASAIGLQHLFILSGTICITTFLSIWIFKPQVRTV